MAPLISSASNGFYVGNSRASKIYLGSNVAYELITVDPDAAAYITAVESADGQALEDGVKTAINTFVLGCKSDGIWDAIKASCILAGARTRIGALTALKGTAPTSYNFIDSDYNRETGLVGNGSTKYLDSNRSSNSDPQNNTHYSIYVTNSGTTTTERSHIGTAFLGTSNSDLNDIVALADNRLAIRSRNANADTGINLFASPAGGGTGFMGASRSASSSFTLRRVGTSSTVNSGVASTSYAPSSSTYAIFARSGSPVSTYSNARISFYSIGEALNLALLDNRVSQLMNDIAAAIL